MSEKVLLITSQLDHVHELELDDSVVKKVKRTFLHRMMGDMTVILVAVNKTTSGASLLYDYNNFCHRMKFKEGRGTCHPRGGRLGSSHGFFDQDIEIRRELYFSYEISPTSDEGSNECFWRINQWYL